MNILIGNRTLKNLEIKEKDYDIRDSRLKGFLIRVYKSGKSSFVVEYGRGKRMTIGSTEVLAPAKARDKAKKILGQVADGADPMAEKKKSEAATLEDYLDKKYGPWVGIKNKGGKKAIARIKSRFPDLLKQRLDEITPYQVEKWQAARLKAGKKPTTVNRDIADLKAALSKAETWGIIDIHPLAKVKPIKTDQKKRVRYLSPDEEKRLRAALADRAEEKRLERDRANNWRSERGRKTYLCLRSIAYVDYLEPMTLLSINTGLRRGETFSLTWQDINFEREPCMLTVEGETAKSGSTRHIPLNAEVVDVLKKWQSQSAGSGFVFPGKEGTRLDNIDRSWGNVLKRAKITDFRWHDLRHHFASRLVMAGVDLNTVRELLGHSDIKMTLRYAHLAPEHKADAVAKLVL